MTLIELNKDVSFVEFLETMAEAKEMEPSCKRKMKYDLMEQQHEGSIKKRKGHIIEQQRQQHQRNWAEIPDNVLSVIFHKLGAAEILLTAQAVCRTWRQLSLDPDTWRCIDMRHFSVPNLHKGGDRLIKHRLAKLAVERSCGHIEKLYAVGIGIHFLNSIVGRTPNLRCLAIHWSHLSGGTLAKLITQCPNLEELHVSLAFMSHKNMADIGRACPKLESLRLDWGLKYSNFDSSFSSSSSPSSDSNTYSNSSSSSDSDTGSDHDFNSDSSSDSDNDSDSESDSWMTNINMPPSYPDPKLDYSEAILFSDGIGREIAHNMPNLRELQLDRFWITSSGLHHILDKCLHLESLDIRTCFDVHDDAVLHAKLAKIKTLRLNKPGNNRSV